MELIQNKPLTMLATELDTFVHKFRQLWNAGLNAHLNLNCHAGAAYVGLQLELGHAPGPAHHQAHPFYHPRRPFTPSYQRRRARRSAARATKDDTVEVSNREDCLVDENNYVEEISTAKDTTNEGVNERNENKDSEKENTEVEAEEAFQDSVNKNHEDDTENESKDEHIENTEKTNEIHEEGKNSLGTENYEKNDSTVQQANAIPDVIAVYSIATIENCPDEKLNEDYVDSIKRFFASEQHLTQNIISTELKYLTGRSFRNNIHTHTVSVIMHVKTTRLWESPASYIRKHLGLSNYWTRSNGTVIKLSRIHQK